MANRQIDDPYHRINADDSYKNKVFNGKKTTTDVYTGEKIYYGNEKGAKHLHGLNKTADVDHVTPIAVVKNRYGDLTIEQQKKIANNPDYNYAMTNSKLNRHGKNALENHEYISGKIKTSIEEVGKGNFKDAASEMRNVSNQAPRMLAAEGKSRVGMAIEGNSYRIQNGAEMLRDNEVIKAGANAVKNAEVELIFVGVQNLMSVLNDEKTGGEAVKDTVGAVGGVAATGMIDQVVFGGAGVTPQIVAVACVMKDSFMKYINDEIDEEEFVKEVAQKGIPLLAGKIVGVATGGNIVAELVVTYACSLIYNEIQTIICDYKSINSMQQEYRSRLNRVSGEMVAELETQKTYLKDAFEKDSIIWNEAIDEGFALIDAGDREGNMQTVSAGINSIMKLFGSEVKFKEVNEVRKFFNMPERVLKL